MTGFDRLRAEIGTDEQDEYLLIALAIREYHRIEAANNEPYLTEYFDYSWIDREKNAYFLANQIRNLKKHYETNWKE